MLLTPRFFENDAVDVAPKLLGCVLVRRFEDGRIFRGLISEVEAYMPNDPACHAFRGPTPRTQVMFGAAGVCYVYLIYGMYHCLNVVTGAENSGQAILIRGLKPLLPDGSFDEKNIKEVNGPGKLCRYLNIDKNLNGIIFDKENALWFESRMEEFKDVAFETTPRIGIRLATDKMWRWVLK